MLKSILDSPENMKNLLITQSSSYEVKPHADARPRPKGSAPTEFFSPIGLAAWLRGTHLSTKNLLTPKLVERPLH